MTRYAASKSDYDPSHHGHIVSVYPQFVGITQDYSEDGDNHSYHVQPQHKYRDNTNGVANYVPPQSEYQIDISNYSQPRRKKGSKKEITHYWDVQSKDNLNQPVDARLEDFVKEKPDAASRLLRLASEGPSDSLDVSFAASYGTAKQREEYQSFLKSPNHPYKGEIRVGKVLESATGSVFMNESANKRVSLDERTESPEWMASPNEQKTDPDPPHSLWDAAADLNFQIDKCKQKLQSLKSRETAVVTAIRQCASDSFSLNPQFQQTARDTLKAEIKAFNMQSGKSRKSKKSYQTRMSQEAAPGSQYSNGTAIGSQQSGAFYYL